MDIQSFTPPHAIGPEKSVLSSLLRKPELLDEAPGLSEDHFHLPGHRVIFSSIVEMMAAGRVPELVSFIQGMADAGKLENIGGPQAVVDVFTYAPHDGFFQQHVEILGEKLALRLALKAAQEAREGVETGEDGEAVYQRLANGLEAISAAIHARVDQSDTKGLLRAAAMRWQELATGKVEPDGMNTSLPEIDAVFRGLKPQRVTVISGLPSEGKSLLGGQLFMDCVSAGHRGLFLSWEMTEDELIDRFAAYQARLPCNAITDPRRYCREVWDTEVPTKATLTSVKSVFMRLAEMPLTVRAMHGRSIIHAAAAIRREHRKAPLKVVVIDFAQALTAPKGLERDSFERQLNFAAETFQNLAQEMGFHGILLSQLNKEGAAKHAEAINERCSLHLKIVNKQETAKDGTPVVDKDGNPVLKVQGLGVVKDRFNGQTGKLFKIALNKKTQRFEPIA